MKNSRTRRFLLFFLISFSFCIVVTSLYISNRSQLERTQMEQLAMTRSNKVSNVLTKLLYKSQILAAFVQQNDGKVENFERIAATIMDDPSMMNVLLAPDGVVTHVYPQRGNESVLGLDFFSEQDGNKEAILARDTQQLVLGGPFRLVQGNLALVGRLPIYVDNEGSRQFWGIASVTLKYPEALADADLESLQSQGFAYEIWRISPDTNERQVIAKSKWDSDKNANFVEYPMEILNAEWYFKLSPIRSWYQFPETWAFLTFGFLLSLLVGALFLHNFDLTTMKHELEALSLNDPLTGVSNRRGCFQLLHELTERAAPFVLCYLDLNYFKQINDQYGHSIGDQVLKHFSQEVQRCLDSSQHKLCRVGGDEFIIIFQDMVEVSETDVYLGKITLALEQHSIPVQGGKGIATTFSAGGAAFPQDGQTADELIAAADRKMYCSKREMQM